MKYYLLHEEYDDPILSWVSEQELEVKLSESCGSDLKYMVVEGYSENDYDDEGLNACLATIPAELALHRLERGEPPVQLRDT